MLKLIATAIATCCILVNPAMSRADEPTLLQLHHTTWTAKDGLPDDVSVISQSPDGMLWLGTSAGLYRFDGVKFEKFEPLAGSFPDQDVYTLQAAPDGSIWVGWRINGISRIKGNHVSNYLEADGIHRGSIWGFAFEKNGHVWAAGLNGLSRFDGKRWERVGPELGYTGTIANAVFVEQAGTVAVFSPQGLFLKRPAEREFRGPRGKSNAFQPPEQGPDGRIYFMDGNSGIRAIESLEKHEEKTYPWIARYSDGQNGNMLLASDGALWFNSGFTLYRQERPLAADAGDKDASSTAQSINHAQGLSGETTYFIFEDREQNVWVSTNKGLDRFRRASVLPVQIDPAILRSQQASVIAKADGSMLAYQGGEDGGILEIDGDGKQRILARGPFKSVVQGKGGYLWAAKLSQIEKLTPEGKVLSSSTLPAEMAAKGFIFAICEAPDGAVWTSIIRSGVRTFKNGKWSEPVRGLYQDGQATALSLSTTPGGKILLGYADNHLAIVDGENIKVYGPDQGLNLMQVAHMAEVQRTIWAAGGRGAAFLRNGRFVAVTLADGRSIPTASGFVEAPEGSLWFNTVEGLLLIPADEVRATIERPDYRPRYRVFNRLDGIIGAVAAVMQPSSAIDGRGRLWFATSYGVYRVDPKRIVRHPSVAVPSVVQAKSGERVVQAPAALLLSAMERDLQIEFTAPTLSIPERVHFRYRLAGYKDSWEEVGTRRQAYFTGLPPGSFRFEVAATNPEGEWSTPLAMSVMVEPRFYQTAWFQAAAVLLMAGMAYALYRFRIRVVERRVRQTMEVKQAERDRIARELHDTLLQGVQGLILKLQALLMKGSTGELVRKELEPILERADSMLAEGRDKVHDLRAPELLSCGLGAALQHVGNELSLQTGMAFCVNIQGPHKLLQPDCEYDLYRIGSEALNNAFRHSGGTQVMLALTHDASGLMLAIRDNGCGIPEELVTRGRSGHYGLPGMRERAAHAGGVIEVHVSEGTEIVIRIPRARAYAGGR